MEIWQIWIAVGIVLLIIEMFTPLLFFASISFGCFMAGLLAYLGLSTFFQALGLGFVSVFFIVLIRPFIIKKKNHTVETGMQGKYFDKRATVIEKITSHSGRVKIYGEEWQAKSISGEEIEVGEEVLINHNESLILFVDKINKGE